MIASIAAEGQATKPAPFGHALVELARSRPEIVGMTADLGKYTDLHIFKEAFPDRYYQMGMAEQLLMGAAAGLAPGGAHDHGRATRALTLRRNFRMRRRGRRVADSGTCAPRGRSSARSASISASANCCLRATPSGSDGTLAPISVGLVLIS